VAGGFKVYNARTRSGSSTYNAVASFVVGPSAVASVDLKDQGSPSDGWNTYVVESDGQPGDVQITRGSLQIAVTEQQLNAARIGACIEQM
jgi:hypothetical protein